MSGAATRGLLALVIVLLLALGGFYLVERTAQGRPDRGLPVRRPL